MGDLSDDELYQQAVQAVVEKLHAQRSEAAAQAELERIWTELRHQRGQSSLGMSRQMRERLEKAGLTADEIRRAGISHDRIRQIVGGEKP